MSPGLHYAAKLVVQAREYRGVSQRELAQQSGMSRSSLGFFEKAEQTPRSESLRKLERFFGWEAGLLSRLISSDEPWAVASIDDLATGLPEADLSDEALLWEVTHRLQSKDERIQALEEQVRTLEAENKRLRET